MLKCRKLQPNNIAVAHELAKAYTADKKYSLGEEQALIAVNSDPKNMWYLQTLLTALKKQGKNASVIKELVPNSSAVLKENLVKILYAEGNYPMAQQFLKDLPKSNFKTKYTTNIADAIEENKQYVQTATFTKSTVNNAAQNPMESYKNRVKFTIRQGNYILLNRIAKDALEQYPSQPYFYYALGLAQNKNKRHREAVKTLESALDYLLDDYKLADNIYRELGDAYTKMGNTTKARMYLMKVKSKT